MNTVKNYPVLTSGAIVGAVLTVLASLVTLGVINLDTAQISAIEAMLTAVIPLVLSIAGALLAQRHTTSLNRPRLDENTPLVPYHHSLDGQSALEPSPDEPTTQ